jgi:hypothetical protein
MSGFNYYEISYFDLIIDRPLKTRDKSNKCLEKMQSLKNLRSYFWPRLDVTSISSDPLAPFDFLFGIFKTFGLTITRQSSRKHILLAVSARFLLFDPIVVMQIMLIPKLKNIVELTSVASILATFLSAFYEMMVFYYNHDAIKCLINEIRDCIADFGVDENFSKRVSMISKVYKGFLAFGFYTFFASAASCFVFYTPVVPMWMPIDIKVELNFWLIYFYQSCGCLYITPVMASLQLLPAFFIVYIHRLLEQLCERLEKIKKHRVLNPDGTINQAEKTDNRLELIKCIDFHIRIYEINKKVSNMFSIVFLVRGIMTCILICTTTFSLFAISDAAIITQFAAYVIYVFIQLFIPCYFGNRIIEISLRISSSIGHSEWMFEDKDYRQHVRIMLEFAKKPMKISSFGLFDVDLENYGIVCRSAYSLFAVCMRLNGK